MSKSMIIKIVILGLILSLFFLPFDIVNEEIIIFDRVIQLGEMPLLFSTFLIAFVDGLNPCSLWVLAFLLGIVALTKDRRKILIIGFTYLLVAGLAYGAFILAMYRVLDYIEHLGLITTIIALMALIFGLINIKDFFWYKKGISLTISDSYKPKFMKRVRNLLNPNNSFKGLVIGSAIMALGITLVELPCTVGLPATWTGIVASYEVSTRMFYLLFSVYILTYFLVEISIFLVVVFTLKINKFEEKQGRILKLIGGLIMVALAIILYFGLTVLENISQTIILFGIIIIVSLIIAEIYEKKVGFEGEDKDGK